MLSNFHGFPLLAGQGGRIEPGVEYLLAFFGGGVHSSNGYNVQVIDWPTVMGILHRIVGAKIDAQEFVGKDGDPNTHFTGHQSLDLWFIFTVLGVTHSSANLFTETVVLVSAKILDLDTLWSEVFDKGIFKRTAKVIGSLASVLPIFLDH